MDTATLKGRLHQLIDVADKKHLEAIYVLLENTMVIPPIYDDETIAMLHERMDNDDQGRSKSYTLEEALAYVRSSRK